MKRYRKKPVAIEAVQWFRNGDHPLDYMSERQGLLEGKQHIWTAQAARNLGWEGEVVRHYRTPDSDGKPCPECGVDLHDHGFIDTLEGGHRVCPGDWIITGVRGERYPCKPDVFALTYEEVEVSSGMTFGEAVVCAQRGDRIQRAGWNGVGMWVVLMPALKLPPHSSQEPARYIGVDTPLDSQPHFALRTAQGTWQPGWNASTPDVLATDWRVVD